jgi:ABC-type branched-subunit amino acid transport system substrate-binding protein
MTIGFLFPYSGIFPDLKEDFRQGFDLALSSDAPQARPTCLAEFVQNGDQKSVEGALKRFLHFERADLVLGVAGNTVTGTCLPMIEKAQTPVIINNLGGHFPGGYLSSPYLFYNGLHLWKSEWAIGKWAQATYGGAPAVSLSLYEAGYHLHQCFQNGIGASGAETMTLNMLRPTHGPVDTMPLIKHLEEQRPTYTHLLLSGEEAAQFLGYLDASPVREGLALTTHPFLGAGHDASYASTWLPALDNPENRLFVERYTTGYETSPQVYALLGYECGLAVAAALNAIDGKPTRAKLAEALGVVHPMGPRGSIALSTRPLRADQPVYLCRRDRVLEELPAVPPDAPYFNDMRGEAAGWLNPYLCV